MSAEIPNVYELVLPQPLCMQWDDEVVVYSPASGDTFLLEEDTARLLDFLREGPASASALAARFESAGAFDEALAYTENAIAHLVSIDLISEQ